MLYLFSIAEVTLIFVKKRKITLIIFWMHVLLEFILFL